jgi:ketosteroid isomerase-like protein
MSQENVEIVRRLLEAWNRRDADGMLAFADPEIEYVNAPGAVEPGTRHGHEGLLRVLRAQWDALPGGEQELDRIEDRGDRIISIGRVSRLMPGGEARIDTAILLAWTIRAGKVTRIEMLATGQDLEKALEAAGLSE